MLLIGLGELRDDAREGAVAAGVSAYGPVVRDRRLLAATAISFLLVVAGYSQITSAFPAWATGPADVSRSIVGFAFAANTWAIVARAAVVLRLVRDWRRTRAVAVTGLVFGASWIVVLAAGEASSRTVAAAGLIAGMAVFGVGESFLSPSLPGIVNRLTGRGDPRPLRRVLQPLVAGRPDDRPADRRRGDRSGPGNGAFSALRSACALAAPAALVFERNLPDSVNRSVPEAS